MKILHWLLVGVLLAAPAELLHAEEPIPAENNNGFNYNYNFTPPTQPQPQPRRAARQYPQQARAYQPPRSVATDEEATSWWSPEKTTYTVGYERAGAPFGGNPISALGQNALVFGGWLGPIFGIEGFLGFTKNDETASSQHLVTGDTAGTTQTVTDTSTPGTTDPIGVILGATLKARLVQSNWFQFYLGGIVAVAPGTSSENPTGTRVQVFPDLAKHPQSSTVTETNLGNQKISRQASFLIGPKIGTEFYLKWIPHLALGFATGILTTIGGDTVTTVNTRSQTYTVTDGVAAAPTGDTKSSSTTTVKQPLRGATFGIGGSNFQFNGVFTLRYIW